MDKPHKYGADDHMSDLICDNYSLLMVMSRFGLALGFGDKTVREVCQAQGVDYRTFLAVANFISEDQYTYSEDDTDFSGVPTCRTSSCASTTNMPRRCAATWSMRTKPSSPTCRG